MNFKLPLYIILGALFMGALVIGLQYTDTGVRQSDGTLVSPRTVDVVVCRGTGNLSDIGVGCDVVCKSSDTLCGSKINSINSNGTIYFRNGYYNIETSITIKSNLHIVLEDGAVFNNTNPTYQIFRSGDLSIKSNISIIGGDFYCQSSNCWYTNGNISDLTIKKVHIHEYNSGGINWFFDAYAPYYNLVFQDNIIEGNSGGYDMIGSGLIYYSDFSHNTFRNGDGQGIGVNRVYYTKFVDNYFENLGNPIGIEGGSNVGNLIDNNIAYYTGNIKLGALIDDNSSFNVVSRNQIHFGGGIQWGNSWNDDISNNIIYGSKNFGIFGLACDHCTISHNELTNTNRNNGATTYNGSTAIGYPSIYLGNSSVIRSPMRNRVFDNSIYRTNSAFVSPNGTSYPNSYPGAIIIDLGVNETLAYNNFEDGNFDAGYLNVGGNSYLLDKDYGSVAITSLSCATTKPISGKRLHNSTTDCLCSGGSWGWCVLK